MWHDMYRFHSLDGRKPRPDEDVQHYQVQHYQSIPDMHEIEDFYDENDEEKTG